MDRQRLTGADRPQSSRCRIRPYMTGGVIDGSWTEHVEVDAFDRTDAAVAAVAASEDGNNLDGIVWRQRQ